MEKIMETTDSYFGVCPLCGCTDGFRNIGRGHWFFCSPCKTKWLAGENLFWSWREENRKTWRENFGYLSEFEEVEPHYPAED